MKKIIHAALITPREILTNHTLEIEEGRIIAFYPDGQVQGNDGQAEIIDAGGSYVTPGLIDIHIHGCVGADTMDATPEALGKMSAELIQHGVTAFYATTVTADRDGLAQALDAVKRYREELPGAQVLGAHVEGPYINLEFKGAQNPLYFRHPDLEEYHAWIAQGMVKLITVAPEIEGAGDLIRYCVDHDVRVAVGHSRASYEQVRAAADLGLSQATHLFNGMAGLHHREPGTVGGVLLDERIYAQIITDGIHLHPAIVELVTRVKGIERTILITDAIRAAGLPDGEYELGGQAVFVHEGAARIANGSLAGSTLMLDQAVRNTMRFSGLDFQTVIQMATRVPAEAMGIAAEHGSIKIGSRADLAFFDKEHQVIAAMLAGEFKYPKESFSGA
jgi:N-acetylglucosamine-6-phosphate deacetylase